MNQIRHHLRPVPLSWVFDVLTTTRGASKRLLSPCKYQERFVAIHILCFTWLDDVQAHYLFVRIVEVLKTKNMGSHLTSSNVRECNLQRQSLVVEPVAARVREWYVDLVYQWGVDGWFVRGRYACAVLLVLRELCLGWTYRRSPKVELAWIHCGNVIVVESWLKKNGWYHAAAVSSSLQCSGCQLDDDLKLERFPRWVAFAIASRASLYQVFVTRILEHHEALERLKDDTTKTNDVSLLAKKPAVSVCCHYGFDYIEDSAASTTLRCLWNIMSMAEPTRQMFVNGEYSRRTLE